MYDEMQPPVREGEEIDDIFIESVGREGDGVAKVDGFVVFVPHAQKGEYVNIKITKVARKVAFAELI
jgi:predicted RNA-binding protein with TRAM domain|tara:strand:- start:1617 stop:1817 length:201 start_codon:yes stop_codon:yes gene_type:complete